jgi:hypothetical protein
METDISGGLLWLGVIGLIVSLIWPMIILIQLGGIWRRASEMESHLRALRKHLAEPDAERNELQ